MRPTGLLLDTIYDNTGDKAARIVMESFFQRRNILHEVLNPLHYDRSRYKTIVVGGGELICNSDGGYYDHFRVPGRHILNAVGVRADHDFDYLNQYQYVTVRSNADRRWLEPTVKDVKVVPCVALLTEPSPLDYRVEPRTIGFHFAPTTLPPRPEVERVLERLRDWKKLFIPFTHYNHDVRCMQPLAEATPDAQLAPYLQPEELFSLIGQLECLVASALHACIFAYANNVPFLAIDLSPAKKIEAFLTERGLEEWLFNDTAELELKLERILQRPPDYSAHFTKDLRSLNEHLDRIESIVKPRGIFASDSAVKQRKSGPTKHYLDHIQRLHKVVRERDFHVARRGTEQLLVLAEKDSAMAEKDAVLAERAAALAQQDALLAERAALLAEKDRLLAEKDGLLAEKHAALEQKEAALAEKDSHIANIEAALHHANAEAASSLRQLEEIRNSVGYRLLERVRRPIRWLFPPGSWRSLPCRALLRPVRWLLKQR